MVLCLKARESRSLPGLPASCSASGGSLILPTVRPVVPQPGIVLLIGAGWSSRVARQAHNLKVVGSNPTPATKNPHISIRYNPPSFRACEGFLCLAPSLLLPILLPAVRFFWVFARLCFTIAHISLR